MKTINLIIIIFILSFQGFSQAREDADDDYQTHYVILITKDGEIKNSFVEGNGISTLINGKLVTGRWYFKAEPDVVTVVGSKGEGLGDIKLNQQKSIKLETDEQESRGGGMSFGVGFGPVGISTGGGGGSRFISYKMGKNKAVLDKQKETKEDKIRREYREKQEMEKQNKELERQAKKAKKKNK